MHHPIVRAGGRWWDTSNSNDGGAVNDNELRKFFAACAKRVGSDQEVTSFQVSTVNPASTGAQHGVRILQQHTPFQHSSIDAVHVDGSWELRTLNSQSFSVGAGVLSGAQHLLVDGQKLAVLTAGTYCYNDASGEWKLCDTSQNSAISRGPSTHGPLRRVFENKYLIVYGTGAGSLLPLLECALFIANLLHDTGDGSARVVSDTADWEVEATGHNIVFVGGKRWNRWSAALLTSVQQGISVDANGVQLGPCYFVGDRVGVAALQPMPDSNQLGLLLDGSSIDAVPALLLRWSRLSCVLLPGC